MDAGGGSCGAAADFAGAGRCRGIAAAPGVRRRYLGDFGGLGRADTGRVGACRGVWRRAGGSLGAVADVCPPGGTGAVVCKGDTGRLRGGPVAYLAGIGAREHRGGFFDGAAGRIFLTGRGLGAG